MALTFWLHVEFQSKHFPNQSLLEGLIRVHADHLKTADTAGPIRHEGGCRNQGANVEVTYDIVAPSGICAAEIVGFGRFRHKEWMFLDHYSHRECVLKLNLAQLK